MLHDNAPVRDIVKEKGRVSQTSNSITQGYQSNQPPSTMFTMSNNIGTSSTPQQQQQSSQNPHGVITGNNAQLQFHRLNVQGIGHNIAKPEYQKIDKQGGHIYQSAGNTPQLDKGNIPITIVGSFLDQQATMQTPNEGTLGLQKLAQEQIYNNSYIVQQNPIGTKSTATLNNVGNLIVREGSQSTSNSQMMMLRGSITGSMQGGNAQTIQQNPASNRASVAQNYSGNQNANTHTQPFKNSKAQGYDKQLFQSNEKKNVFSSTAGNNIIGNPAQINIQTGLFPRISNLRNEVTVLFKNTSNSQNGKIHFVIHIDRQPKNQLANQVASGNRQIVKPLSSPRSGQQPLSQHNLLTETSFLGGTKILLDKMQHQQPNHALNEMSNNIQLGTKNQENIMMVGKDEYSRSLIDQNEREGKNKKRLKSNHTHNKTQMPSDVKQADTQEHIKQNNYQNDEVEESFISENQYHNQQYYYTEKLKNERSPYDNAQKSQMKDDTSIGAQSRHNALQEEQNTPQMMSSHSNKRHENMPIRQNNNQGPINSSNGQSQSQQNQQFFSRRAGSNKDSNLPFKYQGFYGQNGQQVDVQNSFDQNIQMSSFSPMNVNQQHKFAIGDNSPITTTGALLQEHENYHRMTSYEKTSNFNSQPNNQYLEDHSPLKTSEDNNEQLKNQLLQEQPKIPVICGFHKRVLLLTSGQGTQNQPMGNGMINTRRMRNKNPNCNHNNNFVFYQPCYNNVKYDDSYKKKEEVLRKVFFKECAREDEKRTSSQQNQQQLKNNDPIVHLKMIENVLMSTLFQDYDHYQQNRHSQNSSIKYQSTVNHPNSQLIIELGLDQSIVAHKAFLLALIQSRKILPDNMIKVLNEFKQSVRDFDNECIYCKYSQYALRESSKTNGSSFIKPDNDTTPVNKDSSGVIQQQIQIPLVDQRVDNLVRMFQSQLFKRSFINTSLMIIQRKMNEKLIAKHKTQSAGLGGIGPTNGMTDKDFSMKQSEKKKQLKNPEGLMPQKKQSLPNGAIIAVPMSSLDQLGNQIQKLSKNLSNPKDKEKYLELKEKYYREFLMKTNLSNGVVINFPKQSFPPYKYYIGRGNNSILVRNALKTRFWWSLGDFEEWEEYNFIWTQWKSNKILARIKTNNDVKAENETKSGLASRDGQSDSLLSTQVTNTDRESTSSAETLLATPARRKRASTLPQNQSQVTNNSKKGTNTNSISNSASKQNNLKLVNIAGAEEGGKEKKETSHSVLTYNHMENNFHLSNKKAIYYNMKVYYEAIGQDWFGVLPLTFHIKEGPNDKEFLKFIEVFKGNDNGQYGNFEKLGKTIWIVKPGENTNRGCGINVCRELQQIRDIVSNTNVNGQKRSYIIQKYIEKPLLYKQRKFDIRCYTLLTTVNGNLQGYWYNEGYLRTSSKDFNLKNVTNRLIHLTNDAVQKKSDDYGKFESGNKLSYADFQKYLDSVDIKCNVIKDIVPQLKKIAQDTIRAVSRKIDPNRRHNTFEVVFMILTSIQIFGYDFMIDEDMKPWLIEVNTNPCLELSGSFLTRLIPQMIENAIKIAVDPLFPPPPWPPAKRHLIPDCIDNKFELVFNELTDAAELKNLPIDDTMNGIIEEDEMEDEGTDDEDDDLA